MRSTSYLLSSDERSRRLLSKGKERMDKITGNGNGVSTSLDEDGKLNAKEEEDVKVICERKTDSSSRSNSDISSTDVKHIAPKISNDRFFRRTLTFIHTLMLLVLGVFSHAAYRQSCNSSCFSTVAHKLSVPLECKKHFILGRMFFYGGLLSVELPFLFLTLKGCRSIGWRVLIRIFSGLCLYFTAHIATGFFYEAFLRH